MRLTLHQNCYNYWLAIGLCYGLMQTTAWATDEPRSPARPAAVSASANPVSPEAGAAPTPAPPPSPVLGGLRQTNPFDANRQLWPDRTPVPPPPPPPLPPPVPAPVTDDDLEIYGVVNAGGVQKALLKLGKRFANVPVGPTGLASVAVGTPIGEFVLAKVETDQILLQAPGGQQWVRFSIKKERASKGNAPSHAGVSSTTAPNVAPVAVHAPPANPFTLGSPPVMGSAPSEASAPSAAAAAPPPAMPPAAPGSLAAAIAAAQAAQAASGANVPPAMPAGMNPFEALLKQQQGR